MDAQRNDPVAAYTANQIGEMLFSGPLNGSDWAVVVDEVPESNFYELTELLVCNPTGSSVTWALMVAPPLHLPASNLTQPYIIQRGVCPAQDSVRRELATAVKTLWKIAIYSTGSPTDNINYHLSAKVVTY